MHAQNNPYVLSVKSETSLLSVGVLAGIGGLWLYRNINPLTDEQLLDLDKADIFAFDQVAIRQWSEPYSVLSDLGLFSSVVIGASTTLFSLKSENHRLKNCLILSSIVGEANLITIGLTELVKSSARRTRPYAYNPLVAEYLKKEKDTRMSFLSGHTSIVACNSFLFAKMYHDYYVSNRKTFLIWLSAATLPAIVAYSRVRAGKHFPTDVIAGYALGAASGVFIPQLHKKRQQDKSWSHLWIPGYSTKWKGVSLLVRF